MMTDDGDGIIDNPQAYGIRDPEAPGEPNYWGQGVSEPVPGTHYETRDEREGRRAGQHDSGEGTGNPGGGGRARG